MRKPFTFQISISDGWCEYQYPLEVKNGEALCIHDVYKRICKTFKCDLTIGKLRMKTKGAQ